MSSIAKVLLGAVLVIAVGAGILALVALALTWLLPIATLGAFAPGFIPCIAILVLALIARGILGSST